MMYQRNDDPQLLDVQQAFAGAQHDDIIKVIPYCEFCIKAQQPNSGVMPAKCEDGVWYHHIIMTVESGALTATVLCTKGD